MLRWWGWLRILAGSETRFWADHPSNMTTNLGWLSILLGANVLDSIDLHPIAVYWKEVLKRKKKFPDFIEGLCGKSLHDRGQEIDNLFGISSGGQEKVVPSWFVKELQQAGAAISPVIECFQKRPPLWLRAQTEDISALELELNNNGLKIQRSSVISHALCLYQPRINLYALPQFRSGKFEIQDLASQVIGMVCDPKPGERWWDVCAGAGGKSLQLATIMRNKGLVVATDIRSWKLADLRRRAKRSRFHNITTREWAGKGIPARHSNFDGVLVDVPCSGTGTWRRNPDGRWTLTPEDLATFPGLQYGILANAAKAVKPGGILIYGTCSICVCENEAVVRRFLDDNPDYMLDSLTHPLTGEKVEGIVKVWPQKADSDASFVARMRRR